MTPTERELWSRIESLEDFVMRLHYRTFTTPFRSESELIANYRKSFPYKSGDPERWKRND